MTAMADGRVVGLSAVSVALLLLAGVADADCFDYCYKNCIANDKSMADYCNYACDKTCEPGPGAPLRPLVAGGGDMGCQLSCARTSCNRLRSGGKAVEACFGQCYDGCKTTTQSRPLRASAGVPTALGTVSDFPASEPKDDTVRPASEPDKDDAVRAARGSVLPSSEPRKDDAVRWPFHHHDKGGVRPAWWPRWNPAPEIHAPPPGPAV